MSRKRKSGCREVPKVEKFRMAFRAEYRFFDEKFQKQGEWIILTQILGLEIYSTSKSNGLMDGEYDSK